MTPLQDGQVPILIINPLPTEVVIYKGTNVATAKPFVELMVAPVSENNSCLSRLMATAKICE